MFYIRFMVTTKEKHTADSQKINKQKRIKAKENLQFTKEDDKRRKKEQ